MMISTIISLVTSVEFDIVGIIFLRYFSFFAKSVCVIELKERHKNWRDNEIVFGCVLHIDCVCLGVSNRKSSSCECVWRMDENRSAYLDWSQSHFDFRVVSSLPVFIVIVFFSWLARRQINKNSKSFRLIGTGKRAQHKRLLSSALCQIIDNSGVDEEKKNSRTTRII